MANVRTIHLPRENKLTLTPDALASGHVVRVYSGSQPTDFTTLSASTVVVLGPFNDERDYRITEVSGTVASSLSFDSIADDELTEALSDYVRNDDPEENVLEVDVDADGTELAAAINGILAILVAKGLMAAEE